MRGRWFAGWFAVTAAVAAPALGQMRHRRPIAASLSISYHRDNRAGGGCSDYACGARCYDGHGGTDLPVPVGTPVLASAPGVVVTTVNGCANYGGYGNACGGYCGNYILVRHDDGNQTIYCHMQNNAHRVARGQRVNCGDVLGLSASSGSSTGPHLHHEWRTGGGVSVDFFRGSCSSSGGLWVTQNPYPQTPGDVCEGPPPPPPPPPCNARVGPFGWSCSGPIAGMTCTLVDEPADPHTWTDNYFCSDLPRGVRWSRSGPIAGMTCTQITEGSEPAAHAWGDNYLCLPSWSVYRFRWSSVGPVPGMQCLPWAEPADPHAWHDNHLCWTRDDQCLRVAEPFAWSCSGPVAGRSCVNVQEAADPHTWGDNFLCGPPSLGLRWSSTGPIAGMDCTPITEGAEPAAHAWHDNHLCVPRGSGYTFRWSSLGPLDGMRCLPWYEPGDPHTWDDNFLCWTYTPPPDAGPDGGADAAADVPHDRSVDVPSVPPPQDASPTTDLARDDASVAEDVAAPMEAAVADDAGPSSDASWVDDLPAKVDLWIDPGRPAPIEGGCACGVLPRATTTPRGLGLLLVALFVRRRKAAPRASS